MTGDELDIAFQKAYDIASGMPQALPQDVMLRIYAYYKQATIGNLNFKQNNDMDLIDAFKTNAWLQISHISSEQAKIEYIALIESIVKKNPKL